MGKETGPRREPLTALATPSLLSAILVSHIRNRETPGIASMVGLDPYAEQEAQKLVTLVKHAGQLEKQRLRKSKMIVFVGPPGTGKTMLSKAIVRDSGDFGKEMVVKPSQLNAGVVGAATKIDDLFGRIIQEATTMKDQDKKNRPDDPRTLFVTIQEVRTLMQQRGTRTASYDDVVEAFLNGMDNLDLLGIKNVVILGTMNDEKTTNSSMDEASLDRIQKINLPKPEAEQVFPVFLHAIRTKLEAGGEAMKKRIDQDTLKLIEDYDKKATAYATEWDKLDAKARKKYKTFRGTRKLDSLADAAVEAYLPLVEKFEELIRITTNFNQRGVVEVVERVFTGDFAAGAHIDTGTRRGRKANKKREKITPDDFVTVATYYLAEHASLRPAA